MKSRNRILTTLVISIVLCGAVAAQTNLTDPYAILNRSFDAQGGLERLKAEKSTYAEATLAIAGLTGTLKAWSQYPNLERSEVDLKVLRITQGDNGTITWVLDSNGKLQKVTKEDEVTRQRREIKRRMADFEHIDPASQLFTAALRGIEKVNDQDCYAVTIANRLNADTLTQYINATTFLPEAVDSKQGVEGSYTTLGDYRQVDGLTVAFHSVQKAHQTGQEQELTITGYQSNPTIDPILFEPPEEKGKDYTFAQGDRSENIPFSFIGAHLYLPVIVGCRERLWILDTGASITVIGRKFAEELGLNIEGDMQGAASGSTVSVSFATLPAFSVKGIEFQEQQVAVIDLDQINRMIGFECAGILGYDFLSRFVTRIDYANELVSFYDPETFIYSGDGVRLDVHMKDNVFEVSASLDGRPAGTWLFDIGATGVDIEPAYARSQGYYDRKGLVGIGAGAGATFESKAIKCDSMQLAGFMIYKPRVGFILSGDQGGAVADNIGGLGNTLFRNFIVYCDYRREQVILEKGAKFNQPWPEDRSGLQLAVGADWKSFEVQYVQPGTPAAKVGFRVGDVLKSVNGIDVRQLSGINALRKVLTGEIGEKFEFVVDRAGNDVKLKLALADLFAK